MNRRARSIRYSRSQVARIIEIARFLNPAARHTYRTLGLKRVGRAFVWLPQ